MGGEFSQCRQTELTEHLKKLKKNNVRPTRGSQKISVNSPRV